MFVKVMCIKNKDCESIILNLYVASLSYYRIIFLIDKAGISMYYYFLCPLKRGLDF